MRLVPAVLVLGVVASAVLGVSAPARTAQAAAAGEGGEASQNEMIGKPAGVFTSTASMHGGHESTLLTMMLPLLHHGMILMGLPYSEQSLLQTRTGGTRYGASRLTSDNENLPLSDDEKALCRALGRRVAETSSKLQAG